MTMTYRGLSSPEVSAAEAHMSLPTNVGAKAPTHKPKEFVFEGFRTQGAIRGPGKSTRARWFLATVGFYRRTARENRARHESPPARGCRVPDGAPNCWA